MERLNRDHRNQVLQMKMKNPLKVSSTSSKIYSLYPELFYEIFKHLNLKDLRSCSLVSSSFRSYCLNYRIKRLVVKENTDGLQNDKWFYSNEFVNNETDLVKPKLFFIYSNKKILSMLKYLKIDFCDTLYDFDLSHLNVHIQLLQLDIDFELKKNGNLKLDNLEILRFKRYNYFCDLSIECARLKVLYYHGSATKLTLKHPESIVDLDTDFYGKNLEPFLNVEYLKGNNVGILFEDTLSILSKLKELHYNNYYESLFESSQFAIENYDQVKSLFNDLLSKKHVYNKPNLVIFFLGIRLVDFRNIDDYNFDSSAEYFYLKNYELLANDNLTFIYKVNYSRLISLIGPSNQLPRDYFDKFDGIRSVESTERIVDELHFFWFIARLNNLRILNLKNPSLSQNFYNELGIICSSLRIFLIVEHPNVQLNFDFMREFKQLHCICVNQELCFESTKSLLYAFKELDRLSNLELKFNMFVFNLYKHRCHNDEIKFSLSCNRLWKENLNFSELFNFFEQFSTVITRSMSRTIYGENLESFRLSSFN